MEKKMRMTMVVSLIAMMVVTIALAGCGDDDENDNVEPVPESISVTDIRLDKTFVELLEGETVTLSAEVIPDNATDKSVSWTSTDDNVATVNDGTVTAVSKGDVTITAKAGSKFVECQVSVLSKPTELPKHSYIMGYLLEEEDVTHIPRDMNTELLDNAAKDKQPDFVDWSAYLPPVKNQGNYGTCVAWATGYYYRAFLRAKGLKLSESDLKDTHNQFSPKDLFWAIPNEDKPDGCDGTYIKSAFDVMLNRGLATWYTVPYENLGDCRSEPENSWTQEAANYKILRYRQIGESEFNVTGFKSYLSKGIPIAFGAKVGDNFMYWKGGVIKSEYSYLGGHAMVICGYDDSKAAFKIVNSWGDDWCEGGYIWVDYEFMFSNFIKYGFVAYSEDKKDDPIVDDGEYDLTPLNLEFFDYDKPGDPDSDDPTWRTIKYDIYNTGTNTIQSSMNWSTALLYYNAYDATDYGFLFIDYYTDNFGSKGQICENWTTDTEWGDPLNVLPVKAEGYSWNNVDIESGQSAAEAVFGVKTRFNWPVQMPITLNGDYYLALSVDAFNNVEESDETNNMLVVSNNNDPIHFENGVPTGMIRQKKGLGKSFTTILNANPNAYTPAEISAFINAKKENGSLEKEAKEWINSGRTHVTVKNKSHE